MGKRRKFILAVVGSPRKNGNCDILCDRVLAGARSAGARVEKFYLQDMDIKPCSACEACQRSKQGRCVIRDDMRQLYSRLKVCDALVIASPIYWMTVSAQTKLFLDRWYPLGAEGAPGIGAKRAVVCLTYGAPDILQSGCDNAARMLNDVFTFLEIPVQFVHASAWRKGDVKSNKAALKKAYQVGRETVK